MISATRTRDTPPLRRFLLALIAVLALVITGLAPTAAFAEVSSLRIDKRVDDSKVAAGLVPGDEFTYTIDLSCDDADCVNVVLSDTLPAEFAGFEFVSSSYTPQTLPLQASSSGCVEAGGLPVEVTEDCSIEVAFQQDLGDGRVGLEAGGTLKLSVVLRAPADLPADWAYNGESIVNTAVAVWDNGRGDLPDEISSSAEAVITVETVIDVEASKSWTPATQQFQPGAESTITLGVENRSNVAGDVLVIQEPTSAVDGASDLGTDNPFRIVDFAGFTTTTLPPAATSVQVDVYTYDPIADAWSWQPGTPGATPVLPDGVDPADVGGIRLTYAGGEIAADAAASTAFTVAQRAEDRDGAALSGGASVTNAISATVVAGDESDSDDATAPFTVGPLTVDVAASKSIAPDELPAGATAVATLGVQNTSNGPVQSLTLSDLDFFDDLMEFGGFPGGIVYPEGATAATITWYVDGTAQTAVPFGSGENPEAPAGTVTGFVIEFTGSIPAGASASIDAEIHPGLGLVSEQERVFRDTNTVDVTATNEVGTASDDATADIEVYFPELDVSLEKTLRPGGAVEPGGSVVAGLTATTGTGVAQVAPTEIVIEDSWREGEPDDFWNAFDIAAIAPTQIPPGATLKIEYQVNGSGPWQVLDQRSAGATAEIYQLSRQELLDALAPVSPSDVTGIRFTFEDVEGFPKGFSVAPNVVFDARSELRDGSGPTDPLDEPDDSQAAQEPTIYENEATAQSRGDVEGLPEGIESEIVDDQATVGVQTPARGPGPGIDVRKRWVEQDDHTTDVDQLDSQSGDLATTRNEWRTGARGLDSVTVSDPATAPGADAPAPAGTVFQAFDLRSIDRVTLADDPLLAWDDITEVALFLDGVWTVIEAPGGSWMGGDGAFVGYELTAEQSAATTGVRLTYTPDDAARTASTDPLRAEPGSGLATSAVGQYRPTFLTWELRNVVRDATGLDAPWVTADQLLNDPEAGTVWNVMRADWTAGDDTGAESDRDNISLLDQPPLVSVQKSATPGTVTIPESADVDPANYPVVVFRIDARNESTARASYVRVTDPIPCAENDAEACVSEPDAWDDDPFDGAEYDADTNPYERLDVQSLRFTAPDEQIDRDASIVTIWDRGTDGTLSTRYRTIAQAEAMTAADLTTVVGVSVVYQGTSPESDGGSIVNGETLRLEITTKVRQHERSDLTQLVQPGDVDNTVLAQSYDPVLTPDGQAATPNDSDDATVQLISALLDVTLVKTIAPDVLLESQLATPVTVTLAATDGDSTAATQQVTITDDDASFWNGVRLADAPNLQVTLPAGADQVRVDVLVDGAWVEGAFAATAALPAVDAAQVTGVRAVFRDEAGEVFSHDAPPADWDAGLSFDVVVLTEPRDGTELELPVQLPNTAEVVSERLDGLYADADDTADDTLDLEPGTHRIDVVKSQPGTSHIVPIGSSLPWTLTFTNTGTGFLTIDEVVDSLPEYLEWDYTDPVFATSDGGTLSTEVTATADETGKEITFAWPEGGQQMSPDEVFTITLSLALIPGLGLDEFTTNTFVVTTQETLEACTNTSGNGEGTVSDLGETQCGTTNYVQAQPGGSISASKYVRGEVDGDLVDGQVNLNNPAASCQVDADGYTRTPCAAYTAVGATDDWKLSVLNSGTVGFPTVSIVDPLPRVGDRLLATGGERRTTFAPVLIPESLAANSLPAGATVTLDVTTSVNPCTGTGEGSAWFDDLLCDTTASWTSVLAYDGEWAAVTGMRVTIDFSGTDAGEFTPGQRLGLHYQTRNDPVSDAHPELAPIDVPTTGGVAWNQIGVVGTDATDHEYSVAPVPAGVTLLSGDLGLRKALEGVTELAPDAVDFRVVCTVAGAQLVLPDAGAVRVEADDDWFERIDGLPLGSECVVSEAGEVGEYGEDSRRGDAQTILIATPNTGEGEIPTAQTALITNVYVDPPVVVPPTTPPTTPPAAGDDLPPTGLDAAQTALLSTLALLLVLMGAWLVRRRVRRARLAG